MIVVRDAFQIKFGRAKEAVTLWKQGLAIGRRAGSQAGSVRLLKDLVGTYYTLVLETTYESLAHYEQTAQAGMGESAWKDWYPQVVPLLEGGHGALRRRARHWREIDRSQRRGCTCPRATLRPPR